tara:strand:+ start:264 stop:506 length:243 start_codon:yes stop_codon:yes gene_type:complete
MAKDKINETANAVSSRSRGGKFDKDKTKQSGQHAQDDFTKMIKKMFSVIDAQLEIEPQGIRINANTLNNIINKKDKKKLN